MTQKDTLKILLKLCEGGQGLVEAKRVELVRAYIEKNFSAENALKLLRLLKRKLGFKISRDAAQIISAGELNAASKEALSTFITNKNKNAQIEFIKDDKLIAGVKISLGDKVWENSLRLSLETLADSLKA